MMGEATKEILGMGILTLETGGLRQVLVGWLAVVLLRVKPLRACVDVGSDGRCGNEAARCARHGGS